MGTRCLTYVYEDNKPLVCLYRQFDGYPSGHGSELAEFLRGRVVVNGLGSDTPKKASNGMGCLAASLVAHFKNSIGGFYIHPIEYDQYCGQDYEYHVYDNLVVVKNPGEVIFSGTWDALHDFCSDDA